MPRQSGLVKISKLGMLRPLPPTQRRRSPSVMRRSTSSPTTCRRSIGSALRRVDVARRSGSLTSRQRAIGSASSRKQASMICCQYSSSRSPASAAIAGVP